MSIQPSNPNPDHAVPAHDYPATPPYGEGFAATTAGSLTPTPPPRRRRGLTLIGLIVAAALALGGTALKLFVLDAKPAGAADPTAAAESFINNLAELNLIEAIGLISPSEQAALAEQSPLTSPAAVKAIADISQAITIDTSDLTATAGAHIADGVERVDLTSGSITISGDAAALKSAVKALMSEAATTTESITADDASDSPHGDFDQAFDELKAKLPLTITMAELAEEFGFTPFIVTVHEDGAWWVSMSATAAQYAAANHKSQS